MTIKKTPEQKMIDKALELVEQFRSGDITQNDIQAKIGKVFGVYSSIENRMVTPADEAKFTNLLQNLKFSVKASSGYMIFYLDEPLQEPYLRRALLFASKG